MTRPKIIAVVGCIVWCLLWAADAWSNERHNQMRIAEKYQAEVGALMPDGTWCDLLGPKIAWEVERAGPKFYEAVGQALHYAAQSGKKPGVILLVKDPALEWRQIYRCAYLCGRHGIEFRIEQWRDPK